MKKRILMFLGIIVCVGSIISCKTKEQETQIEEEIQIEEKVLEEGVLFIGEEMYDLTELPQDIIGDMVANGVIVIDSLTGYLYDTNGMLSEKDIFELKSESTELGNMLEVHVDNVSATYSSNVVLAEFLIENSETVYRTWNAITQCSEEEDIKCLEDYVPCAVTKSRPAYVCIYADGKPMSLQAYEEPLKVLMKAREEERLKEALKEYLKEVSYVPKAITCVRRKGIDGLEERFDYEEIEGALWIMLAAQDAGKMLDSAEITSYDIVVYEKAGDAMWCKVYHHYYDDAWDPRKYWNEEDDNEVD